MRSLSVTEYIWPDICDITKMLLVFYFWWYFFQHLVVWFPNESSTLIETGTYMMSYCLRLH